MVELRVYQNGDLIQTMEGESVIATVKNDDQQGLTILGRFSPETMIKMISVTVVNAVRNVFKVEPGTIGDQAIMKMIVGAINAEAKDPSTSTEDLEEEIEEVEE